MAEGLGLVDLERELTCSICTDLLYQPLTLLDCLHTFCGACLKEWFAFQASTATSLHPYTCPSCRAAVRSTQRNAQVTTLLDMFLKANPERGKSDKEKESDREKYKPGDNVLPKLRRRGQDDEEERRVLEEVQQLSLREVGIERGNDSGREGEGDRDRERAGGRSTLEVPSDSGRRRRSRSRGERSRDPSRSSRHSGRSEHRERSRNPPEPSSSAARDTVPPRHLDHQSSLRSLLSASEVDSQEMEEEIMRQIMEEGLLDGIDLNNIDVAQEDEISERIAQAYRRRQSERQRERRERRERLAREGRIEASSSAASTPQEVRSPAARDEQPRRRTHARSESGTSTPVSLNTNVTPSSSRPPVSRPSLMEAANLSGRNRGRSSSQSSSTSARRANRPAALSVSSTTQAARSASDLSVRPRADSNLSERRRQSDHQQQSSLDGRQQFRNSLQAQASSNPDSPRRSAFHFVTSESPSTTTPVLGSPVASPPFSATTSAPSQPPTARRTTDPTSVRQRRQPSNTGTPPINSPATFPRSTTDLAAVELPADVTPTLFPEPSISCKRCGKEHIEYELHYNCSRCDQGDYNICLNCYRTRKGCKHWFGFGWAAWPRYEREAPPGGYPPNHEHPHILIGRRYRRPLMPLTESPDPPHTLKSADDPTYRLEAGVFCDICKAFANACYWKCDTCNEGAWGFCNDCVNQGRHCTHPLLPIAHKPKESKNITPTTTITSDSVPSSPPIETTARAAPLSPGLAPPTTEHSATTPPLTPKTASLIRGPGLITIANTIFRPLTFTTICNICTYPIPPSHTRYHCQKCNKGDYDICMSCYHNLVVSGHISKEDGLNGWRRCLKGHRMVIVGFEDRDGGQRRVVVRDLVGGFALRDTGETDSSSSTSSSQQQQQPRSPTSPIAPSRNPNWSWRDTDGSIQKYRTPNSSNTTNPSGIAAGQRFPPDGGVGLRVQAIWSYFPAEGVADELGFPKMAEIREAEDINGDWFWGVYAGRKGLFPGNYGRVVGGSSGEAGRMI